MNKKTTTQQEKKKCAKSKPKPKADNTGKKDIQITNNLF